MGSGAGLQIAMQKLPEPLQTCKIIDSSLGRYLRTTNRDQRRSVCRVVRHCDESNRVVLIVLDRRETYGGQPVYGSEERRERCDWYGLRCGCDQEKMEREQNDYFEANGSIYH